MIGSGGHGAHQCFDLLADVWMKLLLGAGRGHKGQDTEANWEGDISPSHRALATTMWVAFVPCADSATN